jgi:hypothetical protein
MLTQHLHPLHLTWKSPKWFTIGYGTWLFWGFHVQLWGCVGWERPMFHTDSLHTLLSAQWKAAGPWDSSASPLDGRKSMDLNIFLGPSHPECYCGWDEMCLCWWNSLRWFNFRLAGILGSSTVPSEYFLAQYDHAKNKGFRCCGFCSPILLFLPLLKQFNTPHMARLKHILFHVNYSPSVWWLNPCNLHIKFCWWTDIIPVWFSDIWYLAQYSDGHCLII